MIRNEKEYKEAAVYFSRTISILSTHQEAYALMGLSYEKLGQNKKALLSYQRLLKLNPKHERANLFIKAWNSR